MCSLFGIIDYGHVLTGKQKNRILAVLSNECEVRGTDATGIAYNHNDRIRIYKRPVAAHKLHFRVPDTVSVVMGHTRMATQGSAKLNYNNHPWSTGRFALAHNGILWNDLELRRSENLPPTFIETDSYIAVQLLAKEKNLDLRSLRKMADLVEGSFVFSVLDLRDNLFFVHGDNPLAIYCYDGFYLYASTTEILNDAEQKLQLHHKGQLRTEEGDILQIDRNGMPTWGHFTPKHSWQHLWRRNYLQFTHRPDYDYLLETANMMGVPSDEVLTLLDFGFSSDEIEELLYDPSALHETVFLLQGCG